MPQPNTDAVIVFAIIALAVVGLIATLIDRGGLPDYPEPAAPFAPTEEADANALRTEREAARASLEAVTEQDDANARSIALSRRLRGGLGFGGLALVLVACGPRKPPEAFPVALAPLPVAEAPPAFEPAPDACTSGGPLLPGAQAFPFAGNDGIARCRAQIVTESRLVELLHAENEARFWQGQAAHQWRYRSIDREYCSELSERRWADAEHYRTEARAQRWITLGAVAGALLLGAGFGYAAGSL